MTVGYVLEKAGINGGIKDKSLALVTKSGVRYVVRGYTNLTFVPLSFLFHDWLQEVTQQRLLDSKKIP
jgi:hypothetical protein